MQTKAYLINWVYFINEFESSWHDNDKQSYMVIEQLIFFIYLKFICKFLSSLRCYLINLWFHAIKHYKFPPIKPKKTLGES